jgi:hypothetical protein
MTTAIPEVRVNDPEKMEALLNTPIHEGDVSPFMNVGQVIDQYMRSESSQYVNRKYGARGAAMMTGPHSNRPILPTGVSVPYMNYIARVSGYPVEPLVVDFSKPDDFGLPVGLADHLHILSRRFAAPYIYTREFEQGVSRYGMGVVNASEGSANTVNQFNHKGNLHNYLFTKAVEDRFREAGLLPQETHLVPDPVVLERSGHSEHFEGYFSTAILDKLDRTAQMYEQVRGEVQEIFARNDVDYYEPTPAVMVRNSWGGGNYATFRVEYNPEDGSYSYKDDDSKRVGLTHEELRHILENAAGECDDSAVVTRFMDVILSPGHNLVVSQAGTYAAEANGQVFGGPTNTMCVGTTSETPKLNGPGPRAVMSYEDYLDNSRKVAWEVAERMRETGDGPAISGVDTMWTGFYEYALGEAINNNPELRARYQKEVVGPITIAEVNKRLTQYSMHLLSIIRIDKALNRDETPTTWGELMRMYQQMGRHRHYKSYDSFQVPEDFLSRVVSERPDLLAGMNESANGAYFVMDQVGGTIGIGFVAHDAGDLIGYEEAMRNYVKTN